MNKIDLKMDVEYVCVECGGDGKEVKQFQFVCLHCFNLRIPIYINGTLYGDLEKENKEQCEFCNGKGSYTRNILVECKYCRGTGYRNWIDFIVRPSKKEKEICNV